MLAVATLVVAACWPAARMPALADSKLESPLITGRVLDEAGKPVAGARVRLYRRDSGWEHRHPVVEEVRAGADGGFRMETSLTPLPLTRSRGLARYVVLADAPGKAAGWRTQPADATRFEGEIVLTAPSSRTVTVIDAQGRPVEGATVAAYNVGDPSSPSPRFRDLLELRPDDGPLAAVTGAAGRATLTQLPKTSSSLVATKPGFAEGFAFREQNTIRLTPAAALTGTVKGPHGEPLAGVKLVLLTAFMWHFEHAVTDANGRFRLEGLPARGWDMSAWTPNKKADGQYKVWLDDTRFAMRTATIVLEPAETRTFDIQAETAGVIHVTLEEKETRKPVAGARIWGFDRETGGSGRFNAYTDEQGRATFYSVPARISLSLAGPPEGVYFNENVLVNAEAHPPFDFAGGETTIRLVMPRIEGEIVSTSGVCKGPDGAPVPDATVVADAGRFLAAGVMSWIRPRRTDRSGGFTLEGVPGGRTVHLYAESADRKLAGTSTIKAPETSTPQFRAAIALVPTATVEISVVDEEKQPLAHHRFQITPRGGEFDHGDRSRTVESDARGRLRVDGIVPGLSYHIQEDVPPREGPIRVAEDGRLPWYDEILVLVPKDR